MLRTSPSADWRRPARSTQGAESHTVARSFALGMLAFLVFGTGRQVLPISLAFLGLVTIAGVAQIVATSLMIHSFALRNYAVGTVYSKTETVFVAIFSTFIAHESLKLGAWI